MTTSVEIRDLRKSYGKFTAVNGISLEIPHGSIFGLLGPNGAGKTTTIRMLMDIIAPDSGSIHFFGRERRSKDLRRVGYLPEERGLYPKMTIIDQLVFLGRLRGLSKSEALPAIENWLERVELAEWGKKKVEELSKGMQQKIQLVGTVLHNPDIVILDEPFSGLDPINQELFKDLLADYKAEGKTVLFSTHIMEQAEKLCDRICLISKGNAVLSGELDRIKRDFGGHSFQLVADGDLARIQEVYGVEHALLDNGGARLVLTADSDGASVLQELVSFLTVHEFRSEAPGLEEIFIKAVKDSG